MISIRTFNDLLKRPILEALIELKKSKDPTIKDVRPSFYKRVKNVNNDDDFITGPNVKNSIGSIANADQSSYVFDIPNREIARNKTGRGILELSADEQEAQYVQAQILLSNLGLIPKVHKSRRVNVNPSNATKINKIKDILERLFEILKLDDEAPAAVLKKLIEYNKIKLDKDVGFNTFDLLNMKKDWPTVLDGLKRKIALTIAGLSERGKKQSKAFKNYFDKLTTGGESNYDGGDIPDEDDTSGESETKAKNLKNIPTVKAFLDKFSSFDRAHKKPLLGEAKANYDNDSSFFDDGYYGSDRYDNDEDIDITDYDDYTDRVLSEEEKYEMFKKAYRIIFPLYTAASQSGLSPVQYLRLQQKLDQVAGALSTNKIKNNLKYLEEKKKPQTVGDYKDVLIEAVARSIKGDNTKEQVSNVFAREATVALRWFHKHLKELGYEKGFTIENLFDYLKTSNENKAKETRYFLKEIYGLTPDDLDTTTYPNFKTFVDKLYRSNDKVLNTYRSIKPKTISTRTNMKRTETATGKAIPMIQNRVGSIDRAITEIQSTIDSLNRRLTQYRQKRELLDEAKERDNAWLSDKLTQLIMVDPKVVGIPKKGSEFLINWGEMTRTQFINRKNEAVLYAFVNDVEPIYKNDYQAKLETNPGTAQKLNNYLIQHKGSFFSRQVSKLKNDLKNSDEKEAYFQTEIEKLQQQIRDLKGEENNTPEQVSRDNSAKGLWDDDNWDENQIDDDITRNPCIIFKTDETAPRFIDPIIKNLQSQLEAFGVTVVWEPEYEEEYGYLYLYYPTDSKMFKIKNPKEIVTVIMKTMRTIASKNNFEYADIQLVNYEFKNNNVYQESPIDKARRRMDGDEDSEEKVVKIKRMKKKKAKPEEDEETGWNNTIVAKINNNNEEQEEEKKTPKCESRYNVTFIPNKVKYPRQYMVDDWRGIRL